MRGSSQQVWCDRVDGVNPLDISCVELLQHGHEDPRVDVWLDVERSNYCQATP